MSVEGNMLRRLKEQGLVDPDQQEKMSSRMENLFCDYVSKAYSSVAMGFNLDNIERLSVNSFEGHYREDEVVDWKDFNEMAKNKSCKLNELAQEANSLLIDGSIDFAEKGIRFFKIAIEAAEVACSLESKRRYEAMLNDFRKKQELA